MWRGEVIAISDCLVEICVVSVNKTYSTVKVYYAGIKSYAIKHGYGLPSEEFHRLNMVLRSLQINVSNMHQKLPITLVRLL